MKWYHHSIIILALVLFTVFFYQDGFGSISFLIAAAYLAVIFYKEVKRLKKNSKIQ
ncbi:hypothetical protein [Sporosarcina pasteurii]|uniref:Uncharacterized protein n=1 Tax=Sporosarcina pasteurii TaxID=1474 RepID=A0A380BDI3_SPOPA|nr:hypothetical protein [Sporosarcina pasteurii]MDS9472299.1 hypothetical protein [Sporosarcina pasteurii]SUI99079.1 Uncharacterised protein [Sporosarcina pasteurii]